MFLKPVLPVFEYILNYEYIKTELCVNKEIPIMGCDGKCYLIKELAKASESEKPISSDKKHITAETTDLFIAELHNYTFSVFNTTTKSSLNSKYTDLYTSLNSYSFFHPPISVS